MKKHFSADALTVHIYDSRTDMGDAAAADIAAAIKEALAHNEVCNMIFAAAPSQNEVLASLAADKTIEWRRINAFHMDEYCNLAPDAPQGFGNFLRRSLFGRVPFRSVSLLRSAGSSPEEICRNYSDLLKSNPVDIVCLGIGENGHIAFNDPDVADFHDARLVKMVALDPVCREQQVHDGCFASIELVPTHALTLTIPALARAPKMFCVVPAAAKADAVRKTLYDPVSERCPASILRQHPGSHLYLEPGSASQL